MRTLLAYRFGRCRKEGNKDLIRRGNIIVLYFIPLLPSNPIWHQCSHRECVSYMCNVRSGILGIVAISIYISVHQ